MNEITKGGSNFVGYEYKEIVCDQEKASMILDAYMNFGWKADDSIRSPGVLGQVSLKLKRDRKIMNKAELTRLQRHFDACMAEIDKIEITKTRTATIWSIAVGIIGTAFMAGSVFAVTATPSQIVLCIILAIPAIIGWLLPLHVFKKLTKKQIEKMTPLIEQKYDEIYEICEKGSKLLM